MLLDQRHSHDVITPIHPLFASAITENIVSFDAQPTGEYHLPQYINATPDRVLPVNGYTWKIPDLNIMAIDGIRNVLRILVNDASVDFIALQNYSDEMQIKAAMAGWSLETNPPKKLAIFYRQHSLERLASSDFNIRDIRSINIMTVTLQLKNPTRHVFHLASMDFLARSTKDSLNNIRTLLGAYPVILAGYFKYPFDIARNDPTTIECIQTEEAKNTIKRYEYHQKNGALLLMKLSNPQSIVLSSESRSIIRYRDQLGLMKAEGLPPMSEAMRQVGCWRPLPIIEHRSTFEVQQCEKYDSLFFAKVKNDLNKAINCEYTETTDQENLLLLYAESLDNVDERDLSVEYQRDGLGRRFISLSFPNNEANERITYLKNTVKGLRPQPFMCVKSDVCSIIFNTVQPEHIRFIKQLPTIYPPFRPRYVDLCTQLLSSAKVLIDYLLIHAECALAICAMSAALLLSWLNVIQALANHDSFYVNNYTTPFIIPTWLLGLWFSASTWMSHAKILVQNPQLKSLNRFFAFMGLLAFAIWGTVYHADGDDALPYTQANAVLANAMGVVTLLAVSMMIVYKLVTRLRAECVHGRDTPDCSTAHCLLTCCIATFDRCSIIRRCCTDREGHFSPSACVDLTTTCCATPPPRQLSIQ